MTSDDVPMLVAKTRDLMLETLKQLSDTCSPGSLSNAPSPTPLLQGERLASYDAVSDVASLQGTVVGARKSAGGQIGESLEGRKGKKYAVA